MALNLNLFKVSREHLKCAQCEVKHPIQGRTKNCVQNSFKVRYKLSLFKAILTKIQTLFGSILNEKMCARERKRGVGKWRVHVRAREGSCVGVRVIVAVLQCTHLKFFGWWDPTTTVKSCGAVNVLLVVVAVAWSSFPLRCFFFLQHTQWFIVYRSLFFCSARPYLFMFHFLRFLLLIAGKHAFYLFNNFKYIFRLSASLNFLFCRQFAFKCH